MHQIAFDVDGTLFDCAPILLPAFEDGIRAFCAAHPELQIEVPDHNAIVATLGMPTDQIFETLFPHLDSGQALEINQNCIRELIRRIHTGEGILYPGVAELFRELAQHHRLVIASNGKRDYIEAILDHYGLTTYISKPLHVLDEVRLSKVDILRSYMNDFKEPTVMVGDRASDREAAEQNGVPFIACIYGHADCSEVEDVAHKAQSVPEIHVQLKAIIGLPFHKEYPPININQP